MSICARFTILLNLARWTPLLKACNHDVSLVCCLGINSVQCDGGEKVFKNCKMTLDPSCPSGLYASVYCDKSDIVDTGECSSIPATQASI